MAIYSNITKFVGGELLYCVARRNDDGEIYPDIRTLSWSADVSRWYAQRDPAIVRFIGEVVGIVTLEVKGVTYD